MLTWLQSLGDACLNPSTDVQDPAGCQILPRLLTHLPHSQFIRIYLPICRSIYVISFSLQLPSRVPLQETWPYIFSHASLLLFFHPTLRCPSTPSPLAERSIARHVSAAHVPRECFTVQLLTPNSNQKPASNRPLFHSCWHFWCDLATSTPRHAQAVWARDTGCLATCGREDAIT
jgi:hypothetical protein